MFSTSSPSLSGINFIFDEDIRPQKVTVFLENATFAQALELLLKMNDLDKKVLNSKTIIIYTNTKTEGEAVPGPGESRSFTSPTSTPKRRSTCCARCCSCGRSTSMRS